MEAQVLEPVESPVAKEAPEDSAKETSEQKKKKQPSNASSTITSTTMAVEYAKPTRTVLMSQYLTSIRMQLTRGVFLVLAALTKAGHLTTSPPHVASHGLNDLETLAHRFRAFRLLSSPEALTFENFKSRLDCDGLDVSIGQ